MFHERLKPRTPPEQPQNDPRTPPEHLRMLQNAGESEFWLLLGISGLKSLPEPPTFSFLALVILVSFLP